MKEIAIAVIGLMMLTGCMTGQSVVDDLKIGAISPMSDWGAYWGVPMVQGMEIAAAELGNVEIVVEDSKGNGKDAVSSAMKLLSVDEVDAAVVDFAPPALAVAPLFESAGVPFVYNAGARSPLTNSFAFKSFLDYSSGCAGMMEHSSGKVGVLVAHMEYAEDCLVGAQSVDSDISVYWYDFGSTDFRTLLEKAERDGVETLLIVGWKNEFEVLFKQMVEGGYSFDVLCGSGSECLVDSSSAFSGLIVSFDFGELGDTEFARRYRSLYPESDAADLTAAAHGYEAVMMISTAASGCDSISGECIRDSLEKVSGYPSALKSSGFENRVLVVETEISIRDR